MFCFVFHPVLIIGVCEAVCNHSCCTLVIYALFFVYIILYFEKRHKTTAQSQGSEKCRACKRSHKALFPIALHVWAIPYLAF